MSTRAAARTGVLGVVFVGLLLVSAGMVTTPGGDLTAAEVRAFYVAHTGVVVVAQLVGLLAAAVFARFARALAVTTAGQVSARRVRWTGYAVVAAAAGTAVPVLVLCLVARRASDVSVHALASASDGSDAVLFATIAAFCAVLAAAEPRSATGRLAGVVAVLAAARVGALLSGSGLLELAAPLGFLLVVLASGLRPPSPAR